MKYYGVIGFIETKENPDEPGVWEPTVTERHYYGDVMRNSRRWDNSSYGTNGDINISNQISIMSDSYAAQHLQFMKYIEWNGCKWSIQTVDVEYPRLLITLGGAYNGYEAGTS